MKGHRTLQRIDWLLAYINRFGFQSICAWDADTVDAFCEAFPEAKKSLIVYTLGANSSPLLNRTAKAAESLGYLVPSSMGNQDAKYYMQRTWCRVWTLTHVGIRRLKEIGKFK